MRAYKTNIPAKYDRMSRPNFGGNGGGDGKNLGKVSP
jgi:hypothetical protein